ncbi:hypothetical protein KY289_022644 [Solanum tuberosum]|nr:hypothetical protein KY289_022644 [Solanum tuberosum]
MAGAVVSYAIRKLDDFLIEEISLRQNVRENVIWLRNELSFMQAFLKDAEKKQAQDNLVQQWVMEITSVANEAVAILETYSLDAAKDGDPTVGFVDRLKACSCIIQKQAKFHNIGKIIQSLKERVMDISRKRGTYGITNNAGEGPSNRPNNQSSMLIRTLRRAVSYADEDQLFVGFQEVFQRLLDELLKKEPRRNVISIYGMGGLGKTTLARNLYNSPSLITTFHTRAWICVSQQYSTPDLLQSIIKSIQGCSEEMLKMLKEMTERDLETHLRNLLKERKYLVVVDDVWHREAWESLKRALPDNKNGSRVILTTRKEDVAERVDGKGFSHKLRFLSKEESWDLLCKKLHPENKMAGADLFSPSMESLAKEMVEKCRGLPLAIVVLGGLLSYRKGVDGWQKVKTHLWQQMKNDSVEITHILSLSYNDLSFELKQCFLYIGIFQEDHVISAEKLMHLWLAEGFIPRIGEEHMEDIAENFLHELISRNLIQVMETFFDKILTCKIHDLLRDLAIQKSMEVNLYDIYDPIVNSVTPFRLRHAIHAQTQSKMSMIFCTMFPHLYVLDLVNIHFDGNVLPDAIGNLVHLKFLGLRNTNLFKLPPSIGKLKCLQTLEASVVDNDSCKLPPQWKDTDASSLVNLQELGMEKIRKSFSLKSIGSLKSLTTLFLVCQYGETFPPFKPLSSCENLQRLWLSGGIEELSDLVKLPKSITVLVLERAVLKEDPMPILGEFPNLKHLELSWAYKGKEITCKANGFGQLETLTLGNLENLVSWHLHTTAMSVIKSLSIFWCPNLKKIPERMEHIAVIDDNQSQREYYHRILTWSVSYKSAIDSTGLLLASARYGSGSTAQVTPSFISLGDNADLWAMTRGGGRRVVQISAAFMFFFSILGKFRVIFASIPSSIMAAIYCFFFRTNFILELFNDTMSVIFTSHATIAAAVAVFLDRTLPFSNDEARKDNGSHWWDKISIAYVHSVNVPEILLLLNSRMVDAVVSYAVKKLGDFLVEEVSLRQSLKENVLWLRNELYFMQAFLKDAEKQQAENHLVQQWVFEITSVANEAVAILEAYSLDAAKDGDHASTFVHRLKACACICKKEAKFHNIGKNIQSLKERVMDISRKRDTYDITQINNNAGEGSSNRPNDSSFTLVRTLRRAVSYADEDQLFVGFQEVFQRLLDELLKKESRRKVLSIYGTGGLGKTTLARNLYNSPSLITTFQTRAWICISQQYSTQDLLRKAWESLKRTLPDNNNGSRVILTTRKEDVTERVDEKGFSHKLRFLNNEESWDLLCKKLHPENKMVGAALFSPSMERLAMEMVDKCRGLPLAIVVLGGILSYRKGVDEWQKVKTHLWQHMKNDSVEITHILSLSYNDLSFELKQCFLYIGIFQEDHAIDAEKLMIHNLLRDLAVQKAMEVNLFDIYDPRVNSLTPFHHRHAIYAETQRYLSLDFSELKWKDTDAAGLINLQELGMERIRKSYSLKSMGSLKSLTTLFLVCQYGETFPPLEPLSSCENLYRLLLSGGIEELADLNKLPKSITVLVLQSTGLEEDPMPILGKFPNLKHLELSWACKGMKITCKGNGFGQLETLKSLLKKIPERMEHFAVLDEDTSISL